MEWGVKAVGKFLLGPPHLLLQHHMLEVGGLFRNRFFLCQLVQLFFDIVRFVFLFCVAHQKCDFP